jgi:hypothetical protein
MRMFAQATLTLLLAFCSGIVKASLNHFTS